MSSSAKARTSSARTARCGQDDVAVGELVGYCLHSLSAAGDLSSLAAVERLVAVTLTGLRPPQ